MAEYFAAYGLTIHSDVDLLLPGISTIPTPDLTIRFNDFLNVLSGHLSWDGVWYEYIGQKQLTLKWDVIGSYLIKSGNEVIINPNKPLKHEDIRMPILGTIMAIVLQQRGCTVLHGSAIAMNGKVILFIGNKGQGKSTLAGWLNKSGFPLLSDDICAMDYIAEEAFTIRPSFPKIKLNPDVLSHFGKNPDHYPQIHPQITKRVRDVGDGFCTEVMPVGAICVLTTGNELQLEQIYGIEAIKEILTHMLINRFPENQPVTLREEIFLQSTKVAQSIPVYRLTRPRNLELLSATTSLLGTIN
jgi:hypothetical protein